MKAAWRIRRLALQQGTQTRPSIPLRFASTAATPVAPSGQASTQPITRDDHPRMHLPNQAGPSNYASRPIPHPAEEDSAFFTSHRPSTSLQDHLALYSQSDARILHHLYNNVYKRREVRDDAFATGIWRRYTRLSPSARSTLNHKSLQNVLRAVVPIPEHMSARREDKRVKPGRAAGNEPHKVDARYGERMARVLRDMEFLLGSVEGGPGPRPSDYRFVFATLAHVGDFHGAEAIADDMRTQGLTMDIRMVDSRLAALYEWLDRTVPGSLHGHRAQRVVSVLWQILGDMSTFNLTPRNATTTLLIQAIYAAKSHITSADVIANLDVVLEDVCAKAYGVDMRDLTIGMEKEKRLKGSHVYALVDYWGRKGDVWKMLSMYEVLAEQPVVGSGAVTEEALEEEEEIPTLSGMIRQEAEGRREMTMFGQRRAKQMSAEAVIEAQRQGRDVPPHLESTTVTPPSDKPTFSHFFPQPLSAPIASASIPTLSYPHIRIHTQTISVLVRHTIAAGDMQLLNHVLASALSSIKQVRTEWLSALQLRQARTGGDPSHEAYFEVPGPRIAVDHQWFWNADFFARKSDASLPERRRFEALVLEAKAQLALEREILAGLAPDSALADAQKVFDPASHLGMIDAAERKLGIVLDRTQEGIDTKVKQWAVAELTWARRQEKKQARERAKVEARDEKRRSRGAPWTEVKEVKEVGVADESGGVVRAAPWTGTDGVRMIGMA